MQPIQGLVIANLAKPDITEPPSPITNPLGIRELEERFCGMDVAIIGNGPTASDKDFGHYKDQGIKVWTVNGGYASHHYTDLEFSMDDIKGPAAGEQGKDIYELIIESRKNACVPIITSTVYEGIPPLVQYPYEEVLTYFDMMGEDETPYFAESICYMVAWAIMIGVNSIRFHGTDYINTRPDERACLEFWCGVAKGHGIKSWTPAKSHFLKSQGVDGINRHIPGLYGVLPRNFPLKYRERSNGTVVVYK